MKLFSWSDWSYGFWKGRPQTKSSIFITLHCTYCQHDLPWLILAEVVFVRFLHRKVTLPHLSVLSSVEGSLQLRSGALCSISLKVDIYLNYLEVFLCGRFVSSPSFIYLFNNIYFLNYYISHLSPLSFTERLFQKFVIQLYYLFTFCIPSWEPTIPYMIFWYAYSKVHSLCCKVLWVLTNT